MIVELRSDTVTRPTAAMREVIASAEVGDDVWREDPTSRRLEERAAEVLGKEAALFVPSGTMANQIALLLHCRPGDEVICGRGAHVRLYESGAGAAWAGVQFAEVGGTDGLFDERELESAIQPGDYHAPRTRLVALENTHNRGGGRVWPIDRLRAVCEKARARGLALHLDGARLWNAAVASGVSEREIAAPFDTVSACFSKGLGAPVGSVIAGSRADVDRALRLRKMLGGGMRQVGLLCAAALHALDHHRARLHEDHANAQRLARGLAAIDGVRMDLARVETNIVIAELDRVSAPELCRLAADQGVRIAPVGPHAVRAVTHLDVDAAGIDRAIAVLGEAMRGAMR
ncbi:threonine aldolase family protein [Sandaracinus amylolyticus]|uniref:threonine aldolase family protein n=1 Tax=Sandaracinus amylolyticus TaxID=927083 RepID=UPI001F00F64E|nr:GntG family PLP-dependent aldolase [Sandaracinus amylolyticus]UJR78779.1 Aminotransferase class I/II-fold pyridoxal phosphate-dependent enzyme [Sandaracinus amylolyticus]